MFLDGQKFGSSLLVGVKSTFNNQVQIPNHIEFITACTYRLMMIPNEFFVFREISISVTLNPKQNQVQNQKVWIFLTIFLSKIFFFK